MLTDVLHRLFASGSSDDSSIIDVRESAQRRVVELKVKLPADRGPVLADAVVAEISLENERIATFAGEQGLQDDVIQRMQMGLDEMMVNIASYSGADSIALRGWAEDSRLTVEISDNGLPFNPFDRAATETDAALEDREIGGLGIDLTRNILSELEYSYVGGRNVVTLISESE
jgi:serine/threonine-protein kinase RsbW